LFFCIAQGTIPAKKEFMARLPKQMAKPTSPAAIAERLQSMLINAAEGRRNVADDRQYPELRQTLRRLTSDMPELLQTHPSLDSFNAYAKTIERRSDRVERIQREFAPLFAPMDDTEVQKSSSAWTGIDSGVARVKAVKSLLPLAQAAVEGMIASLSEPNANNAPLLEQHEEAIANLRDLHSTLGALLEAADSGHLEDELGDGLAAEASRYAKRAARALSRDPMPYLASGLLLGLLHACGVPAIGGFLSDIALNMRKNSPAKDR
jgi:hypothetical protein